MHATIRLASDQTRVRYPLAVSGELVWHHEARAHEDRAKSRWTAEVMLPPVPAEHIIVPSYAMLGQPYEYQFTLEDRSSTQSSIMQPVPDSAASPAQGWPASKHDLAATSLEIDCWHTVQAADELSLRVTVEAEEKPRLDLLSLSLRALHLSASEPPPIALETCKPVPLSQMLANKDLARRICSPTALSMALSVNPTEVDWPQSVQQCYDRHSRAYGKWPLAIHYASGVGTLGAVESFSDWGQAISALRAGMPLVCSIRYKEGELGGAPLTKTAGHLLVLYGIDTAAGVVRVMDPAAAATAAGPREYAIDEFTAAWLNYRGGVYVFEPSWAER